MTATPQHNSYLKPNNSQSRCSVRATRLGCGSNSTTADVDEKLCLPWRFLTGTPASHHWFYEMPDFKETAKLSVICQRLRIPDVFNVNELIYTDYGLHTNPWFC